MHHPSIYKMPRRELIIFKISFIFSFEIISVILPDPIIFFKKAASVADAAAVNNNWIKTVLMASFY